MAKQKRQKTRSKKGRMRRSAALLVMVLGMLTLLYPVFATLISNYSQERVAVATINSMQTDFTPAQIKQKISKAREYNTQLHTGPILDPFLQRVAPDTKLYRDYLKILDFDGLIGSIRIPKIHTRLPIYHGTDDATLMKGAGHLFGTAMPVGGKSTHTVITAHSGLSSATMFDELPQLKKGDVFFFDVGNIHLKYRVYAKEVVTPTTTDSLYPVAGKDLATLITCTPYGVNSHRLLVHAERVPLEPGDVPAHASIEVANIVRWWMFLPIGLVLAVAIFVPLYLRRRAKKRRGV